MSTERNDLALYDEVAADWWSDDVRWIRTLKNMVPGRMRYFDRFVNWDGKSVLDVGCAGGFMAEALAERGARVTGIDPAENAIEAARAHASAHDRDIAYDVGVGESLPYDDASFDVIVCVDVLEHVSDLERVIREIARVLKPGGQFCFDTINRNPLASFAVVTLAEDVLRLLPRGTHDPELFIRPQRMLTLLREAGFVPGELTGLGPTGIDRRGDPTFGRLPFTGIIYMGTAAKPGGTGPACSRRTRNT